MLRSPRIPAAALVAAFLACACSSAGEFRAGGLSLKTEVQGTWKDPKYASPPLAKILVISLMKIEPGGRDAVENAVVARLASAGVSGVASHTVMSNNAEKPGPSLEEAIKASGAEGVLMIEVRSIGAYDTYSVGQSMSAITPDTMASYNYLTGQVVSQPGEYKVAVIVSELYLPSMGKQVWTAYTNSYDASNLARNLPDYTLKLVDVMARDRIIASPPKAS